MSYVGDFSSGDTVYLKFTTRQSTGVPTQLAGSPAISIYKDASNVQSTEGVTLTVDFDSLTGLNHVAINTAANATFYSDLSQYSAVITAGTVNAVNVAGEVAGRFTLRAQATIYPTVAGRKLDVSSGGEAGIDWANIGSPSSAQNLSSTTVMNSLNVATNIADIQSRLPAALVSGRMESNVGAMNSAVIVAATFAANAIDSSALDATAISEIQSGLALAANVSAIATEVTAINTTVAASNTAVNAIKAKTDNLPADPADASDIASSFSTVNTKLDTIDDFIDSEVAAINSTVNVIATNVSAIKAITDVLTIKKNTALSNFEFLMTDSTLHAPATGLSVTATRSIDGASFGSCANAVSEVGSGIYKINLATTDLNGTVVTFKFTATGADPKYVTIVPQP